MATVTLEAIEKRFGPRGGTGFRLGPLSLSLPNGRTTVLLGPSGCGKTTLLRIVAGLVKPSGGQVYFGEEDVTQLPPRERRLGMVFQDFALYPHFTSKKNILAHFFFQGKTPELDEDAREKYKRTSDLMGVDIAYLLDRKPKGLSTGERQRVALARCITRDPLLFLLDEPFSNLDATLREKYRSNLKRLLNEFRITTLYVTHDQGEALLLADTIVIMKDGQSIQQGSYRELYQSPKNIFVANFLNPDALTPALNLVEGALVDKHFAGKLIGVRPEDVTLEPEKARFSVEATLTDRLDLPTKPVSLLSALVGGEPFYASVAHPNRVLPERVRLGLERFQVFDKETGLRLEDYPSPA